MNTQVEQVARLVDELNIVACIDHSGRGGNMFFLTIFDRHPEVISIPVMHYAYSYVGGFLNGRQTVSESEAYTYLTSKGYSRLLCQDPEGEAGELVERMGGPRYLKFPREELRALIAQYCQAKKSLNRRELILLPYAAYAVVTGRDLDACKYALISDAISLRHENVLDGFSGVVIDQMVSDFPSARICNIVRDPRATFASPRHQFVNSLGNMYAIEPESYVARFSQLLQREFSPDNGAVYLYWLLYLSQTARTIRRKKEEYPSHTATVRNEDLNLNFASTMRTVTDWIGVLMPEFYREEPFVPTVLGEPWQGTGAYNNRYQKNLTGPLQNDSPKQSRVATGPNKYVTERWKTKLSLHEIRLIEGLFADELDDLGYPRSMMGRDKSTRTLMSLLAPMKGELPNLDWLRMGFKLDWSEFSRRLFYSCTFAPFSLVSRAILADLIFRKGFFTDASPMPEHATRLGMP